MHNRGHYARKIRDRQDASENTLPEAVSGVSTHCTQARKERKLDQEDSGKIHYFGPIGDPDGALKKYLDQRDDLHAGRLPRAKQEGITLEELSELFLTFKQTRVDGGELSVRTLHDYTRSCQTICDTLGKTRVVSDLYAADFEKLRTALATRQTTVIDKSRKKRSKPKLAKSGKPKSMVSLANGIRMARILFKWAYENDMIDKPIRFGSSFESPTKKSLRAERNAKPVRMFEASELRLIIMAAKPIMRSMVLLAINCAYGQTDMSSIPRKAIDLQTGWIDYPRPKTEVKRRCNLWPETIDALREAFKVMPSAKTPEDKGCAFVTKYGARFVRATPNGTVIDGIGLEFKKLLKSLKMSRDGLNMYAIRHTFQTIADDVANKNHVASTFIMGHSPASSDMSASYRELVSDARIKEVTDAVRVWLWPAGSEAAWIEAEKTEGKK